MPIAPVSGNEICYETFGPQDATPLVLVNGLGSQMIRWPQGFIDQLVDAGFRVIVHDNRDVGLSTKFTHVDTNPPYTVGDMANDTIGVLDHLGIQAAHVAGMSMGGMICQILAIEHPERVLSLASVMSAMGGEDHVLSENREALAIFAEKSEKERDKVIEQAVRHRRLISGPGFPFDEEAERDLAGRVYDRCYAPDGRRRQMLAIQAARGRSKALSKTAIPTVVIHGTDDPLIPVENGRKMAEVVSDAKLVEIEGMGHDLPEGAWSTITSAIADNAKRAATV
ncbi:MAG TPA: alpha/beta hydrolase [Actinomycetota bacterium]|jgi:pimeloyl-ACP methyl ester carboxylesterase|nr:alpha/beta hydrolase [Actinomycetota bacterium]